MQISFKGIIFDLDGTLVQSHLDFALMRKELDCPKETGILEYIDSLPETETRKLAHDIVERHEIESAQSASWMPGAEHLLEIIQQRNIPVGIVTRNTEKAVFPMINSLSMPVKDVITREHALPKPAPDGLLQLADRWSTQPDKLIYVGDHLFDLLAAKNASMTACLYAPEGRSPYLEHADLVINSLDELISWLPESII